jgi:hypothetical protein
MCENVHWVHRFSRASNHNTRFKLEKQTSFAELLTSDIRRSERPKIAVLIPTLNEGASIGSRLSRHIAAMIRTNLFDNRVLTAVACALFKKEITDLCTGFWGYRRCVIHRMDLGARGFEIEADMFVECARYGFSVGEVSIDYHKRADRPKSSSISDGLKIGSFFVKATDDS